MTTYQIDHLQQDSSQAVWGPLQDDESFLLMGLIQISRIKRVLCFSSEGPGHSSILRTSVLRAMGEGGVLYTADRVPADQDGEGHKVVLKLPSEVIPEDVDNLPLGMVVFDYLNLEECSLAFHRLTNSGMIDVKTLLVVHNTNLHYRNLEEKGHSGVVHCPYAREMVNELADNGYHVVNFGTSQADHGPDFPFRHGLTACQKYRRLPYTGLF